jgi:hypothetical protein
MHDLDDFFDMEKVKARVFLLKSDDKKNQALLSDEKLMVVRNGKKYLYSVNEIASLASESKKLLMPLVIGGVLAPFSFLSYFTNIFHPLMHLIFTLIGLLLFYVGWVGKHALTIKKGKGEEDFIFLPEISRNLKAFIDYVNTKINSKSYSRLTDLIFISRKGMNISTLTAFSEASQDFSPAKGYTYRQMVHLKKSFDDYFAIDPTLAGREIKFEYDRDLDDLRPCIDHPVRKEAVRTV